MKRIAAHKQKAPIAQMLGWLKWLFKWVLVAGLAFMGFVMLAVPLYNFINPPSTQMLARWLSLQPVSHEWVDYDDLSDRLKLSVVTSEDVHFCAHHGVDWQALGREYDAFIQGRRPRGASTISMQLSKNLFLWSSRSYVRKGLEVPIALYIDLMIPKQRQLEIYLNIVEWGEDGEYGAQAAADAHFNKPARALTWRQASLMAITLPNPRVRDTAQPSAGMERLARLNRQRARQAVGLLDCLPPLSLQ